jgi:uncharacterized protein (DUF433 family)
MIMRALTSTEVAAFAGVDERRVRKDVEHGLFGAASPPRFELAALVYFRCLLELGFDLGVEDRKRFYGIINEALHRDRLPTRLLIGPVVELKLGYVVRELRGILARFEAWKRKLLTDEGTLGGEPVFPKSRLAVRQVGAMLLRGAAPDEVREDYPYLTKEDVEFARIYAEAYPRVGRPRERQAAPR